MLNQSSRAAVMKFGGTSVDNPKEISEIVHQESQFATPILVASAYSNQTDRLLEIAKATLDSRLQVNDIYKLFDPIAEHTLRMAKQGLEGAASTERMSSIERLIHKQITLIVDRVSFAMRPSSLSSLGQIDASVTDTIAGAGEILSIHSLASILTARDQEGRTFRAVPLHDILQYSPTAPQVGLNQKNKQRLYANIVNGMVPKLQEVFSAGESPILSGHFGYVPGGNIPTFSRGYTEAAAAFASRACLEFGLSEADIILQIWKEVPGLMSGDPRIVEPNYNPKTQRRVDDFRVARVRSHVSRNEAAELSGLAGMKAINPNVFDILQGFDINAEVRSTFYPEDPGTLITRDEVTESRGIRFIAGRTGETVFRISGDTFSETTGVLKKIYQIAAQMGISVNATSSSERTVSFSVNAQGSDLDELEKRLGRLGEVTRYPDLAMLCCIGNDMADRRGVLSLITTILAANDINIMFDCGDPDSNISVIIAKNDLKKAIGVLHHHIIVNGYQSMNDHPAFIALREALRTMTDES